MATLTVKSTLDGTLEVSSVSTDNTLVNLKMISGSNQIAAQYSAMDLLQAIHNAMNSKGGT